MTYNPVEKIADLLDSFDVYDNKDEFDQDFYNYCTLDGLHDAMWELNVLVSEIKEIIYEK